MFISHEIQKKKLEKQMSTFYDISNSFIGLSLIGQLTQVSFSSESEQIMFLITDQTPGWKVKFKIEFLEWFLVVNNYKYQKYTNT